VKIKPDSIVIGTRIPVGQIVGGFVTLSCVIYDFTHPGNPLPATVAAMASQVLIGLVQIIVVNWVGITMPDSDE
jgi:hypothetical protein